MATDKLVEIDHVTDYISRQAAIRAAFKLCRNTDYPFIDDIQNAIEEIPAADVRTVVRGHWIKRKGWDKYVCSECSNEEKAVRNFCPRCGAKMENPMPMFKEV